MIVPPDCLTISPTLGSLAFTVIRPHLVLVRKARRCLSLHFGLLANDPKRDGCHECHYLNLGQHKLFVGWKVNVKRGPQRGNKTSEIAIITNGRDYRTMAKSPTRELVPQQSELPQPRRRNVYDYDGEYEFATARHWITPEATLFPGKSRLP
jgi:hypothetical protein